MKLISSRKTKRRIALMFVFAFMLSNLLSLFGPSAQAAVTITAPSTGTCFQHAGTTVSGALVTVYNIGTIQFSLTAAEISPGQDAAAAAGNSGSAGTANATTAGAISNASDVTGNVFSFIPPSGTNFVIVPGFQDTAVGASNELLAANATISNAASQDSTGGTTDSALGISVGVVADDGADTDAAGIGRAIVAIARDADSTATSNATAGNETYPKSGTGSNTATITISGLGIAIPPSGNGALSGTLQATLDANPPSGIGLSAGLVSGAVGATVSAAIPGLTGTINLCTVTSAAGQIEAVLDVDNDSTEQYDKSGTSAANLLALGSVASNTRVWAFDTNTVAAGVTATALVDIEPILIRGLAGTGSATRDQVIATGELLNSITSAALSPSGAASPATLDLATYFGNSVVAPITIAFADDNASATSSLLAVDIIIENSTTGAAPASAGFNAAPSSRHGFLGALRAAIFDTATAATNTTFNAGAAWGVVSAGASGAAGLLRPTVQEGKTAAGTDNLGALGAIAGNTTEPFNNTFVDLRLECGASTNPVAGWFAIINSTATNLGTTEGTQQVIKASQAGESYVVSSTSTLYKQSLTNIGGSNPVNATSFRGATLGGGAGDGVSTGGNALLYATCTNNTLTLFPIQGGVDLTRDFISVTPLIQVTGISSTFSSDVNLLAEVSGNNLTGSTSLMLAKLVGVPTTGGTSNLASAQGVGVAANGQLGVTCSSGGNSSVVLSSIVSGTVDTAVTAACTSGAISTAPTFFTGGAVASVSGTTVIDGSPTVQGESRGVLVKEASVSGFNELVSQIGGGTQGTVFEVQLPTGCDFIDDRDDNNTAVSTTAATGGNDVTRVTIGSTAGVTAAVSAGGAGDAALTNANVLEPASGSNPAKARFRLNAVGGATDTATTDAVLLAFNSQDIFCPTTTTGDLTAKVVANNKVSSATLSANLGNVNLGTAKTAAKFSFGDDVATSTKGEVSTNTMLGATPRLVGGGVTTSHTLVVEEGDAKAFPIGATISPRNLDPDNSVLSTVLTRGQLWFVPAAGTAFSAAPAVADVSFSDNSLVLDGNPLLVSTATVDANAPLGSILIGIKRNTASGAADPAISTTKITVKNAKLTAATSSTTDLVASVEFFSQDAGVVVNTPGAAGANSSTTPTVFTPFAPGSTKAFTQINGSTAAATSVQLGSGTLSNSLLTSRLTTLGTPQLNPFAKVLSSAMNADSTKISVSSAAATASSGGTTTDNAITVTGSAGAVDGGAEVVVTTGGSTTYDSVTVVASDDGSFTAKVLGDCATAASVTVSVTEQVSGTKTTAVTKTSLCSGATGETEDSVFTEIAGSDGSATIAEVLSYVSAQGGLSAIVTSGGAKLSGVIKAAKAALGLS